MSKDEEIKDPFVVLKNDMEQWKKGNVYPFSCYGPVDKPCLPGFEDISPEELRYSYYQNYKRTLQLHEKSQLNRQRYASTDASDEKIVKNVLDRVHLHDEKIRGNPWEKPKGLGLFDKIPNPFENPEVSQALLKRSTSASYLASCCLTVVGPNECLHNHHHNANAKPGYYSEFAPSHSTTGVQKTGLIDIRRFGLEESDEI